MDKNLTYGEKYCEKLNDYVRKGYLKKLSHDETATTSPLTYYLPHFGVINPNKPDKLRIVFDAAAKTKTGHSLNDFLLTGPDLYNSLQTILINFRLNKIAFVGDIREMFLQVKVRQDDRHAQRILWRDMNRDKPPDTYEIQVVFFGAKCSPSIAQEVKNRNAFEFKDMYPSAYEEIVLKHYMDDYLGGSESIEDAITLIQDVQTVHRAAGFEMCNWICNSKDVLDRIDNTTNLKKDKEFSDGLSEERILGLWWNYDTDTFAYRLKFHKIHPDILNLTKLPTKRDVLKVIMSLFDPLGFLANFLIAGKILLQSIWDSGISWDDTLIEEHLVVWKDWCSKLSQLENVIIPRQYTTFPLTKCNIQLHIFCDASKYAYATCAYLRFSFEDKVECMLVMSKSRVAPLKPTSIPRLELQAALLGSRLFKYLKDSMTLKIHKTFLWSDSEVVLNWIKTSSRRFKVFVAQRLGEIQELTDTSDWRYVPSKLNIADDATKIKPVDLSPDSPWIKGPDFLYQDMTKWPEKGYKLPKNFIDDEEYTVEFINLLTEEDEIVNITLPDVTRFSNWNRFLRATAWVIRFTDMIRYGIEQPENPELQPEEIAHAELLIYRKIQMDSYMNEIICLKQNSTIPKTSSLYKFPLTFSTDKLIRLSGRLNNTDDEDLSYNSKNPIVLDHKHPITRLIIQHFHKQNSHVGTETIISNLRRTFWITSCRNAVKRAAIECQYCKNVKAKPIIPIMGQLPDCRVNPTIRAFIKTGVDYFGPIEVTVNRSHEKRYGVIFTCMVTRAIHLEIAHDLSSNAFIHVFRQFGCRRGFPHELYSDNGTNFRKADKEIREAIDSWPHDELTQFATMRNCKWMFNPPSAPHMGGAWERLIQSVKQHLSYMLKDKYPKEYVLRTLFCEIENIINNRPLTHIPLDSYDSNPLTPNDLLIGPSNTSLQFAQTTDRDLNLLNMWKASQRLTDIFWDKWKKIYRQHILCSTKWSKDNRCIELNDVVLIIDPDGPRNTWPKGIVTGIFPAKDGKVRVVDVKTISGTYRRPVAKLIKLNVSS